MRPVVIRFALLSLIIVTVAIRMNAVRTRDSLDASFDFDLAVKSLIESQGLLLNNERLSCQVRIRGDVRIEIPDEGKFPHIKYSH